MMTAVAVAGGDARALASRRTAAGLVLGLILSLNSPAIGCSVIDVDEAGNLIPAPSLDENIAASERVFVGTVKGFRLYSGEVIEKSIECWEDPAYGPGECEVFSWSIMTVILSVDHAIKGIGPGRLYEELYDAGDGDCGPWFQYGKRYIYNTAIFGVEELPDEPSEVLLDHWRSLQGPEVDSAGVLPQQFEQTCNTPDELIAGDLARSNDAYVATVGKFRLDDTTLTDDVSACRDLASATCAAFTDRIIAVQVDAESLIKGEMQPGPGEIAFWRRECPLPNPGERYLLGGYAPHSWSNLDQPRVLLSEPPTENQLAAWRLAGRAIVEK